MSKILESIIEKYGDEELLIADGFDDAILGVEDTTLRVIYSIRKCIEILMADGIEEYEEAVEYFYFNTVGAYVGEKTPIWCDDEY